MTKLVVLHSYAKVSIDGYILFQVKHSLFTHSLYQNFLRQERECVGGLVRKSTCHCPRDVSKMVRCLEPIPATSLLAESAEFPILSALLARASSRRTIW